MIVHFVDIDRIVDITKHFFHKKVRKEIKTICKKHLLIVGTFIVLRV